MLAGLIGIVFSKQGQVVCGVFILGFFFIFMCVFFGRPHTALSPYDSLPISHATVTPMPSWNQNHF